MTKMTNRLATAALATGLALGTAGAAAAAVDTDTDMTAIPTGVGTTELNTAFTRMTTGELAELRGQEVYDIEGTRIGRIQRLVRGVENHNLYYVVEPLGFVGDPHDLGVVPVKKLQWLKGDIVLNYRYPRIPLTASEGFPYKNFSNTDDTWTPKTS